MMTEVVHKRFAKVSRALKLTCPLENKANVTMKNFSGFNAYHFPRIVSMPLNSRGDCPGRTFSGPIMYVWPATANSVNHGEVDSHKNTYLQSSLHNT